MKEHQFRAHQLNCRCVVRGSGGQEYQIPNPKGLTCLHLELIRKENLKDG
jgi:hypothetical protein